MKSKAVLKFDKNKDSKQNIEIFLTYLKTLEKPFSTILFNAFSQSLDENEFRQKVKEDILAHLEKCR